MDWLNSIRTVREGRDPDTVARPHFLHVASVAGEGGIERCSVDLARRLQAHGARVTYACAPDGFIEARCLAAGIPTLPFRPRKNGDPAEARRLALWMREHDVALVHVHSRRDYFTTALSALWTRPRGPRLVLHAHLLQPLGRPLRLSGWFFQRAAGAVIAVSDAVRDDLQTRHHLPPGFVTRLYNGVDLASFAAPGSAPWRALRACQRREWGVPPDALVVGMVGRLDDKGQDALLANALQVLSGHPSSWFVLVGPGDRDRYRALAWDGGVATRTVTPGTSERIPAAMAGFDALAHLPADEAFGLVLAEAMAAGLPTVAADVGGCREAVRDGVTGFLVPPGDSAALRHCLTRLLDSGTGAGLRRELGRAGRCRAEREFGAEPWVEGVLRLYGAVLTPVRVSGPNQGCGLVST